MEHSRFHYQNLSELVQDIEARGLNLPWQEDLSPLRKEVQVGCKTAANALAVLPMEGCDSEADGSPSELVRRRYLRYAEGGSGLLWWEACAVVVEGKANPRQMFLTPENLSQFQSLLQEVKMRSLDRFHDQPIQILQLTHSGRYSRPHSHKGEPMIPQHDPLLDPRVGLKGDEPVISDEYLEQLPQHYVRSALLAQEAGFDGVDIKSCHRYLLSEILASHTREGSFGGSFANRSRLLLKIIRDVRQACGEDFIIASRFNVFDAHPYPYGFGCRPENMWDFDPTEPVQLVEAMCAAGVDLLSNSAGNPYYIYPQVTRPFDQSSKGIPVPEEHQLKSIERLFQFTELIQKTAGDIPVVGNGYSWLRQFFPYFGAANLAQKRCQFVGLGRSSFAYPTAAADLLEKGELDPKKVCISCSKCTQIMRDHGRTGCVIRDREIYLPLFQEAEADAKTREEAFQ